MTEKEMINQINSLTDDKETSEVFEKDVEALEMILNKYNELSDRIVKASRKIDKFKETYIICFDKPLWDFVKRLEKCLKSGDD